ncbi:hypothetical protein FRC05_008869 [Tulasnella sp. 425]|nr:hypothetical protein FRC05_008869 [Tulasnella sp. 425]
MGILWSHQIVSADPEHRATARPFFSRSRIADVQLLERHVDTFLEGLQTRAAQPAALDIQAAFKALTLDITTDFLFGVTTNSLADVFREKPGDASPTLQPSFAAAFEEISAIITKRVRIGASWYKYFEPFGDKTLRPKAIIDAFVDPVLATAWARHEQLGTTDKNELKDNPDYKFIDHLINTAIDEDRELVKDELLNFLLAGRDTTASLLTFCLYILATNPDITQRLKSEIFAAFGNNSIQGTDSLKQLTYLRAVIDETLRLFPPVPFNIRRSINPITLPSAKGPLWMPGRTSITFVPFIFHRDREVWGDDCEEFRPERWISGDARDPKRVNAYVPFSAGPRLCLGQQFAYNVTSYVLVRVLQRFSFELAPGVQPKGSCPPSHWHQEPQLIRRKLIERVWPQASLTLSVKGGLWIWPQTNDLVD